MRDRILVRRLRLLIVLGIEDWERTAPQEVFVDYEIKTDLSLAGASDQILDTLNYRTVNKAVLALAERGGIRTAERLATLVAETILSFNHAQAATVRVTKPGALRHAESVAVEIQRER